MLNGDVASFIELVLHHLRKGHEWLLRLFKFKTSRSRLVSRLPFFGCFLQLDLHEKQPERGYLQLTNFAFRLAWRKSCPGLTI